MTTLAKNPNNQDLETLKWFQDLKRSFDEGDHESVGQAIDAAVKMLKRKLEEQH